MDWLKNVSKFKINELFEKFDIIKYMKFDNDICFKVFSKSIPLGYKLYCYEEFNEQTGEITYCVYGRGKV